LRISITGVQPRPPVIMLMRPVSYARSIASTLASERAAVRLPSTPMPPTCSFSDTNCSTVIAPLCRAFQPYCTPTLSGSTRRPRPSASVP
jgi:hypothetical protein